MFELEHLEPKLEHNRQESRVLFRRIWQAALVALVVLVPVGVLTPPDRAGLAIGSWMGTFLVVAGYFEARRVMVFLRDLREQRDPSEHTPPTP